MIEFKLIIRSRKHYDMLIVSPKCATKLQELCRCWRLNLKRLDHDREFLRKWPHSKDSSKVKPKGVALEEKKFNAN